MFNICYLVLIAVIIAAIPTSKIIINDFITEIKEVFEK